MYFFSLKTRLFPQLFQIALEKENTTKKKKRSNFNDSRVKKKLYNIYFLGMNLSE